MKFWIMAGVLGISALYAGIPNAKDVDVDSEGVRINYNSDQDNGGVVFVPSGQVTWAKTFITSQRDEIWFLAPNHHAATDMDNDGDIDIVFTALSDGEPWWGQVYIAYQQTFPSFTVQAVSPEVRTPYALDVDDRNGDGMKDILYAAARYREDSDMWGTDYYGHQFWLVAPSWNALDLGEYSFPNHCAAWDFDNDGVLDAVFGDEQSAVYVALTGGGGTVQAMSGYGEGIALGDFNEDGQMDIVSAGWGPVAVALNNGNGASWTTRVLHSTNMGGAHGVQVGDVNGDGHLDIVGGHRDITLWLGNGDGTFTERVVYSNFANVWDIWGDGTDLLSEVEVGIADIDGDGDNDIIASTTRPLVHTIAWLDNTGGNPPSFQMWPVEAGTGQGSYGVEVVDVNRDGCVDIVAGVDQNLYVWLNTDCATDIKEGLVGQPVKDLEFTARVSGNNMVLEATRPVDIGLVEVYTATGALVARKTFTGQQATVKLPQTQGVYLRVVRTEGERFTGRILGSSSGAFRLSTGKVKVGQWEEMEF